MLGDGRRRPGVDVGGRAHLERHPAVADERRQPAELGPALVVEPDVVDDAHAVAEALGPAELHASQIDGSPKASPAWIVMWLLASAIVPEGVEVPGRRVAGLAAGDVEADDARVAVAQGQLGDLLGVGGVRMAVTSMPMVIGRPALPSRKPSSTASTTSSRVRPPLEVQLGGEADLGVDDAVVGQVLGALGRHPHDGVRSA